MGCECGGYCHRCRGMIWSFLGILLLLNAFIWPKWLGVDGWMAFIGVLLMLTGVWKSFVHGCSCPKDECCRPEPHKEVHPEPHVETHTFAPDLPPIHHDAPPVRAHKPKSRRR